MAKKLKKLPNFLNKSPWLWRSCTQLSRTLSFRTSNDIFRTMNSAYDEDEETPRADMSSDDDQIEALVRGLRVRPAGKRLFLELDESNSISRVAVTSGVEVPFEESVAMEMDSKEPYLEFKKSMEEMMEAEGLKDWKGMEMLLKANAKPNHEVIIGAFVDLLVAQHPSFNHFSCCFCCCNNSSTTSSLLCSSYSFASSSCSSCSSSSS